MISNIDAFVFDAFGTLIDINGVDAALRQHFGHSAGRVGDLWRRKQLEYSWLSALMGRYRPFSKLTADALRYAVHYFGGQLSESQMDLLFQAYQELQIFPEVTSMLDDLLGLPLLVLSNADGLMLRNALEFNAIADKFEDVLSADQCSTFKPHPTVYQLAVDRLGLAPRSIGFVSSNAWDAAGA
ncbi:MAG: haloacid dehalogenase type II, partial [Saprospiraceae bacterium]|nr:haloacid dehalogenase type II [Saprospiraceae bacterium]